MIPQNADSNADLMGCVYVTGLFAEPAKRKGVVAEKVRFLLMQ